MIYDQVKIKENVGVLPNGLGQDAQLGLILCIPNSLTKHFLEMKLM